MTILDEIKTGLGDEWKRFEAFFREVLQNEVELLNTVNNYLLDRRGKQLRPVLTLLTANSFNGGGQSVLVAAVMVEMVHTASLLHDDVVDNADQRRGAASVKRIWRSNIAVLTGDYWFATASLLVTKYNETRLLPHFNTCMKAMTEGEIWQLEKAQKLNITEEEYYQIIGRKTAEFLALSMICGAIVSDADQAAVQRMHDIGYAMGMAFQIRDDIFDYERDNRSGKPAGNDIREQKITLPLLYALQQVDEKERQTILAHIRRARRRTKSVTKIIDFVRQHKGLEYAEKVMTDYSTKAATLLQTLPESPSRTALADLAKFMTTRRE
ncbi:MAG: polyprenyl synthetase family protein [Prevotellaceae bacterium]|jgi:octaprenyl-diphosphate synthase|nr:polyprenyl synthetase family protein [Prevotellaceae bacterium]